MAKSTNRAARRCSHVAIRRRKACRLLIRGKRWRIEIARPHRNLATGTCDITTRTIRISPSTKNKFETLVHEILHACFWDLSEFAVDEAEQAICKGLRLLERSCFATSPDATP